MSTKSMTILGAICVVIGFLAWGLVPPALLPARESGGDASQINWDLITWNVSVASTCAGALFGFGVGMLVASFFSKKAKEAHPADED